ncbi:MAG: hypothetical protein ACKN92_03525, partial [Candidatus Nanopelagicaceae bacterium]
MDPLYLALCLLILIGTALTRKRSGISYLLALTCWVGSEIATNLISSPWSSAGYVAFYPFIFLAIPGLFEIAVSSQLVRLIDGAVLVLGSSTIATALLLRSFEADFLHLLYPVCDIVILIAVLVAFVRRPINGRSLLVLTGFLIYTA